MKRQQLKIELERKFRVMTCELWFIIIGTVACPKQQNSGGIGPIQIILCPMIGPRLSLSTLSVQW